jgi:hypothetical protein
MVALALDLINGERMYMLLLAIAISFARGMLMEHLFYDIACRAVPWLTRVLLADAKERADNMKKDPAPASTRLQSRLQKILHQLRLPHDHDAFIAYVERLKTNMHIGMVHSYNHNSMCRTLFASKWVKGTGTMGGEWCEIVHSPQKKIVNRVRWMRHGGEQKWRCYSTLAQSFDPSSVSLAYVVRKSSCMQVARMLWLTSTGLTILDGCCSCPGR